MSPLHKLPNGAWIDLTLIAVVRPYEGLVIGSNAYPPGIAVMWGSSCISLSFSSLSDAESYADELAALVNKPRAVRSDDKPAALTVLKSIMASMPRSLDRGALTIGQWQAARDVIGAADLAEHIATEGLGAQSRPAGRG